ncbi:conserved hypothetical protein [Paecilomyces variotii No. 5]|uniref:Uncharacterized protein n=1 Tax=Byssochlamys spectabilis (strain No. 5 / NBRC 109023) TaxID=1356009 RepID=V5G8B9_BYSSN|nr:conserved hypothetical protein [Paecilomyces variotii No. 5]
MKYDISTLLAMSQNGSIDIGKFSVHALENNLLSRRRASTNVLTERSVNRSRVASNFSATHSEESPFTSGGPLQYPCRQPRNAPHENLAQTDVGFARFLKEHASPKHHRVTAGGRIVPMNPELPAPEFKLPIKKHEAADSGSQRRSEALAERRASSSGIHAAPAQDAHSDANSKATEPTSVSGTIRSAATSYLGFDGPGRDAPIIGSQYTAPAMQNPFPQSQFALGTSNINSSQPVQMHQDCMTFAPNHGAYAVSSDQVNWFPNSNSLAAQGAPTPFVAAPNQQSTAGPASQFSAPVGSIPSMFSSGNTWKLPTGAPFYPLVGMSSTPIFSTVFPAVNPSLLSLPPQQDFAVQKALQEANRTHETLSAQLSSIDRYMALHNFDRDHSSKRLLVENRMQLVRELDAIRLYKEQLESNLRQHDPLTSTDNRTAYASGFDTMFASTGPGDVSSNANMQNIWIPALTAGNASSIWTPTIQSTFAPMLPTNESLNPSFPYQFPAIGSIASMHSALAYGDPRTNSVNTYGDQQIRPDWGIGANQDLNAQMRHALSTEQAGTKDISAESPGWATAAQSAPLEISHLYYRIEEAAQRGEPIEELLKELTAVTTRLSQPIAVENAASRPGVSSLTASDSHGNRMQGKSQSKVAHVGDVRKGTEAVQTQKQPFTSNGKPRARGRSRKSAQSTIQSSDKGNQGLHEAEDEDGKSCYSCLSTTDSWATIQEGDKRWLARETARGKLNEEPKEGMGAVFGPGKSRGRSGLGNRAVNIRNTAEWIQNIDHEARPTHEPGNASSSTDPSNLGNQGVVQQSNLQTGAPWKRNQRGRRSSKKECAPAVSQKLNAYGFLPPFDGPGDQPETGVSRTDANHVGNGYSRANAAHRPHAAQQPWYQKRVRDKPAADEVREYFRRIEADEEQMLDKYQIGDGRGEAR